VEISINGAVVFWSISEWSDRQTLKDGLEALGLGKFVPDRRTNFACLRDALGEAYPSKDYRIEPLDDTDSFEVVKIIKGTDRNTYAHEVKASIDKYRNITITPWSLQIDRAVVDNFNKYLGLVRSHQVTESLVQIVDFLSGTRLRPKGSIYWLPDHKLDEWEQVRNVVRTAARGKTELFVMRVVKDKDALRAVTAAITAEIEAEVARIEADVQSGTLGVRALDTRKNQAVDLASKINLYEELCERPLTSLREAVTRAEIAASQAAILASVKVEAA